MTTIKNEIELLETKNDVIISVLHPLSLLQGVLLTIFKDALTIKWPDNPEMCEQVYKIWEYCCGFPLCAFIAIYIIVALMNRRKIEKLKDKLK